MTNAPEAPHPRAEKLLFSGFAFKFPVIARPVRTLVVAIPRLEGKCTEKYQYNWESPQFLVVIVTWFHSSGGLPHQSADWFAMTGNFEAKPFKHQFILPIPRLTAFGKNYALHKCNFMLYCYSYAIFY